MKLMMLITADYASIDRATGKLNILGAFSRISTKKFPTKHKRMAVVVKIRAELGDHSDLRALSVVMVDEDGTEHIRVPGRFRLPPGHGGVRPEFNAVLELNGLKFPKPGTYEFRVLVDEEMLGYTSIELVEIKRQSE
jgi:hypothetical protein